MAVGEEFADGDVLLVTSKVVSKVEGRLIPSPTDPEERDALVPVAAGEALTALAADVRVQVFRHATHAPFLSRGDGDMYVYSPQTDNVRRIATSAGCSTMGLYSRFGGKDGRTVYVTDADQKRIVQFRSDLPGLEWTRWPGRSEPPAADPAREGSGSLVRHATRPPSGWRTGVRRPNSAKK